MHTQHPPRAQDAVDNPIRVARGEHYDRYIFSDDILRRVRQCRVTDNFHGPRELLEDWIVILAVGALSLWLWRAAALWLSIPAYVLALFFIGGRQRALADILHQSAHRTLARSRWLNHFIGTFCSGYLIFQSLSGYRVSHVLKHHGHFADPEIDPDYLHYQRNALCGPNMNPRSVKRYLLSLLTPVAISDYLRYLIVHRMLPADERGSERRLRVAYISCVALIVFFNGWEGIVFAYWIVPLVTTQAWIGAVIELFEHYPMIEDPRRIDMFMTRNRNCGRLPNFLLGLQQYEGYHFIHHKFPFVPPWRNIEVHQICMEDSLYRSLNRSKGWLPLWREVLNAGETAATIRETPQSV